MNRVVHFLIVYLMYITAICEYSVIPFKLWILFEKCFEILDGNLLVSILFFLLWETKNYSLKMNQKIPQGKSHFDD